MSSSDLHEKEQRKQRSVSKSVREDLEELKKLLPRWPLWSDLEEERIVDMIPKLVEEVERYQWQPIETAPKDGTEILGWCEHEAFAEYDPETGERLGEYHFYAESNGWCGDGAHVIQWGGGNSDYDEFRGISYDTPEWWFRADSDFEIAANPTHWMPLPTPPALQSGGSNAG